MKGELKLNKVSVSSSDGENVLFRNTSLRLESGCTIGIMGKTGSGKSTILRMLAQAQTSSLWSIKYEIDFLPQTFPEWSRSYIAFLQQSPIDNLITRSVRDELYFSLESSDFSRKECDEIVIETCDILNISQELMSKSTGKLSVGEAQKIALAEALSRKCRLLLLDEPTSHLDSEAKAGFLKVLNRFKSNNPDCIIVIASHDLNFLYDISDFLYEIDNSKLQIITNEPLPNQEIFQSNYLNKEYTTSKILEIEKINYHRDGENILNDINFSLARGERLFIKGPNGSGKTTLLKIITGLEKRNNRIKNNQITGHVWLNGNDIIESFEILCPDQIYMTMQNPNHQILADTVNNELKLNHLFWDSIKNDLKLSEIMLEIFDSWKIRKEIATYSLSHGQKKVLSLIPAFERKPKVLILDEIFSAIDYELQLKLIKALDKLSDMGTIVIVTGHDSEVANMLNCKTYYLDE